MPSETIYSVRVEVCHDFGSWEKHYEQTCYTIEEANLTAQQIYSKWKTPLAKPTRVCVVTKTIVWDSDWKT